MTINKCNMGRILNDLDLDCFEAGPALPWSLWLLPCAPILKRLAFRATCRGRATGRARRRRAHVPDLRRLQEGRLRQVPKGIHLNCNSTKWAPLNQLINIIKYCRVIRMVAGHLVLSVNYEVAFFLMWTEPRSESNS